MDTDMVLVPTDTVDTPMPTTMIATWERGPLMPNLRLMPMPLLTHGTDITDVDTVDTMAVDITVTPDTDTVMAVTTVRKLATIHCHFLPCLLIDQPPFIELPSQLNTA